jgi:hypothetical protein
VMSAPATNSFSPVGEHQRAPRCPRAAATPPRARPATSRLSALVSGGSTLTHRSPDVLYQQRVPGHCVASRQPPGPDWPGDQAARPPGTLSLPRAANHQPPMLTYRSAGYRCRAWVNPVTAADQRRHRRRGSRLEWYRGRAVHLESGVHPVRRADLGPRPCAAPASPIWGRSSPRSSRRGAVHRRARALAFVYSRCESCLPGLAVVVSLALAGCATAPASVCRPRSGARSRAAGRRRGRVQNHWSPTRCAPRRHGWRLGTDVQRCRASDQPVQRQEVPFRYDNRRTTAIERTPSAGQLPRSPTCSSPSPGRSYRRRPLVLRCSSGAAT